ncbi:acid-sensing ion channel 1A-like [Haliotis asinina]|uniref:acid-sensing ion channel 1A-like n=1 Tax=Haliotis asinina TaxID=109174 RepID=UPI00353227CF
MSVASEVSQGPEGKPAPVTESSPTQGFKRPGFWGRRHHHCNGDPGNSTVEGSLQDGVPHSTDGEGRRRHPWAARHGFRHNMEQYGPGPHGPEFVPPMEGQHYGWGHQVWRRCGGMLKTEERALFKEFDFCSLFVSREECKEREQPEVDVTDTDKTPDVQTKMALPIKVKSPGPWRQVWYSFAGDTSLHACKNLVKTQKTFAERIWWFIILCLMVICLLWIIVSLTLSYLKYPVLTKSSVEYLPSMDFPTITFCNANGYNSSLAGNPTAMEELFVSLNPTLARLTKVNASAVSPLMKTEQAFLYRTMSLRKGDYLRLAFFRGQEVSLDMFDEVNGVTGICFRFNSEEMIRRHGVQTTSTPGPSGSLELLLDIHQEYYFPGPLNLAAMMIYINHPSDKQSHLDPVITVAPGTTAYISMTKHQYKFLPKPFKSFGDDSCIDTDSPSFVNPLKYASSYSFKACIDECVSHLSTTNCRCKTTSDPDDLPYPNCTLEELFNCSFKYTRSIYYNQTLQREFCPCYKPCRFIVYDTKLSYGAFPSNSVTDYMVRNSVVPSAEYARQNLVSINIWYERLIVQKLEYEPEYTLTSMVGTLGGQMGFFLGASIVTLYEVFEACFRSINAFARQWCTRKQIRRPGPEH